MVGFLFSSGRARDARGGAVDPVFLSIDTRSLPPSRKIYFRGDQRGPGSLNPSTAPVSPSSLSSWSWSFAFVFVVVFASGARPGSRVSQRHLLEIERPNNLPRITSDASLPLSLSPSPPFSLPFFSLFKRARCIGFLKKPRRLFPFGLLRSSLFLAAQWSVRFLRSPVS